MKIRNALLLTVLFTVCLLLPGCTSTGGGQETTVPPTTLTPEPVATTPATLPETTATTIPVPATTVATPTVDPDAAFNASVEQCLGATPVVSSLMTEMTLTSCLQKTPRPAGACAQAYRKNLLKYVEDDTTTAGFERINTNLAVLRTRYDDGQRYDTTILGWVSCGNGSVIETYEMDHR